MFFIFYLKCAAHGCAYPDDKEPRYKLKQEERYSQIYNEFSTKSHEICN